MFLCHSSEDKPVVRELYQKLRVAGCRPWLDEEDLIGGTRWEDAIEEAVRAADVVVVCLSPWSVTKEGYLQREIRFAIGVADEKPDDTIFIVPLKLQECDLPKRLKQWQSIDYFKENGYSRLLTSLRQRAQQIGARLVAPPFPTTQELSKLQAAKPKDEYEKATEAANFILSRTNLRPPVGMILGSGLGSYAEGIRDSAIFKYSDIPHLHAPTVVGHAGRLVVGQSNGVPVAAFQGRFHLYEGLKLDEVVFPVRVLARMGACVVILTAAAGLLNPDLPLGSLVVLSDHINLLGANAILDTADGRFGSRFVDLSEVYSRRLRMLAHKVASERQIPIYEGVYAVHAGPTYETPAEVRFMRNQGADLVGMSTVPEAIVASHVGMEVLAICVAMAHAAGLRPDCPSHTEVLELGQTVQARLKSLLDGVLPQIMGL